MLDKRKGYALRRRNRAKQEVLGSPVAPERAALPGVITCQHRQVATRARSCRLAWSPHSRIRRSSAAWPASYGLRRAVYALRHGLSNEAGAHGLRTAAEHWYLRGRARLRMVLIN